MTHEPRLRLSYIGPSGAVEVSAISPKAAARRWPELFRVLEAEVAGEAQRLEAQQEELPLFAAAGGGGAGCRKEGRG